MSPKYKKGDVVEYGNGTARPSGYNPPMVILESVITDDSEFRFIEYRVLSGDSVIWIIEKCIELVND